MACEKCCARKAVVVLSKTHARVCKECFYEMFEEEVHRTITETKMFKKGECVGVGVSGGKDSTVLIHVLDALNRKYEYGIRLVMLCVDEGIEGYRNRSIEMVERNQELLGFPLRTISYEELFGLTMDQVVQRIGLRGNCSYCGVFRRQALEKIGQEVGADCIVTGHNADDMAETVLLNLLRGDEPRFRRCTFSRTQLQSSEETGTVSLPRCKPFKNSYQKDIVLYAYFKKLPYFSLECSYSPNASRGDTRSFIKELERLDPMIIGNIIKGAEAFQIEGKNTVAGICKSCSHPSSSNDGFCSACRLLRQLNSVSINTSKK